MRGVMLETTAPFPLGLDESGLNGTRRVNRSSLSEQVQLLMEQLHTLEKVEHRRHQRIAIPFLFRFTPLDDDGQPLRGEEIAVVGKDLSPRGLGFFHEGPLPYRRAILTSDHPKLGQFSVEIDITWCRSTTLGWYESGARLLHAVPPH